MGLIEIDIVKVLGIEYEKLEGLFFVEMYYFMKGISDVEIFKWVN